jgi:hypothetical protein
MTIDKHTLALISIVGSSLDVLGALYLAYDLLGGEHGPLRTLTRAVTYGAIFGIGFGLPFGPLFGIVNGVTHGTTLAWEFSRASRQGPKPGLLYDTTMSAIRGAGYAVGFAHLYGATFGITFGALSAVGQVVAYQFGMRPTIDYQPTKRPRLTKWQFLGTVNRSIGYGISGYISALVARERAIALSVGLTVGVVVGVLTGIVITCTSFIEWGADHLPEKRMGVLGVGLILVGFALQSIQYWLTLLDVNII